jgi:ribosomal protein S18 acetylase RimI-like enzyme
MPLSDYPKIVELYDGTRLTIRLLQPDDGPRLLKFFQELPEEDRLYMKHDVTDPQVINRWVRNIDYDSVFSLLALDRDEVVADGTLHIAQHGWMRHIGEIRLAVARSFQDRGLGTLLAHELFGRAVEMGMDKIQVLAFEDYMPAIRMCQKLGFEKAAALPGHIKDQRGCLHNLVVMVNDVQKLWSQIEDIVSHMDGHFSMDHSPGA